MAFSNKSQGVPTNEQIIDDITKDFLQNLSVSSDTKQTEAQKDDNQQKPTENSHSEENSTHSHSEDSPTSHVPEDFEHSDPDEPEGTLPDDFIDEEKLKDLETTLSEEDKAERHREALKYKEHGNEAFKWEQYLESITFYTDALKICPLHFSSDRAILFANRAASKAKLNRKQSALEDCTRAIELNDTYLKAYLRRAKLHEESDKLDESLADYKKILELDPHNKEALEAQVRLPPMINERNEKMKEEMMGKLKDLGNLILKPFGLSTDNFQLTQDPNTGGYSVNFNQGK